RRRPPWPLLFPYTTLFRSRQAVEHIAGRHQAVILAVAGGIVSDPETFDFLLEHFHTIWLKAEPEEHMARVRGQGDLRPMAGNPADRKSTRLNSSHVKISYA